MSNDGRIADLSNVALDQVPVARRVPFDAPWAWLAAGWRDLWLVPRTSLVYGAVFAFAALVVLVGLAQLGAASAFLALAGGFLLIGPFLAVGLYETSRRIARGSKPRLRDVAWAWLTARGQLGFFGAMLLFVYLVWLQIAFLLLMFFLGGAGLPPPEAFMHALLFTPSGLGLLIVGTMVGGLIAALVFAISALALPMLLVKQVDAISAAQASLAAVAANPRPMALWAGLIVMIMGAGFMMMLVGLIIAFPLIGHATWHAYVDVCGDREHIA